MAWRMFLCGAGFAFFQTSNNRTIVTAAPHERSGAAGGMLATARVVGQTVGATGMAMFFHFSAGDPTRAAMGVAAALAVAAMVVSLMRQGGHEATDGR